jgi:hypothetical protein
MMTAISPADYIAASEVLYRSFWLIDNGRASEAAAFFMPDGSLTFGPGAPKPGTISGEQIGQMMTAREAQKQVTSRHVLSNVLITPLAEGRIELRALMTLFRTESDQLVSDVASVADVVDTLVRSGNEWKIEARLIQPVFNR